MTYETETASISRTPISVLEITLDFCNNVYGSDYGDVWDDGELWDDDDSWSDAGSICEATGTEGNECYNTFPTCHDKNNYVKSSKLYRFSSFDAPQPIDSKGSRPYLKPVNHLPTEIKNNFNIRQRVFVTMVDEPDFDIGVDVYASTRTSQQGTFWKKFIARNPNYKGRPAVIKEGYADLPIDDYKTRFNGILENIEILDSGDIRIEIVSLLADLSKVETPQDLGIELVGGVTDSSLELIVSDATDLESLEYIKIEDEIIRYSGVTLAQNRLTGLTRGSEGTTAVAHDAEENVQPCRLFDFDNPYTHLQTMLTEGGIDVGNIDTAAFTFWAGWPHIDIDYRALIIEPISLDVLFWELVNVLDVIVWQNEDQKITIRKNMPNNPDQTSTKVTDDGNIVNSSGKTDLNARSRRTRAIAYWNRISLGAQGDLEKIEEYGNIIVSVDQDAESEDSHNDVIEEKLFIRWISSPGNVTDKIIKDYVELLTSRRLLRKRDALPIITYSLEKKDEGILTGDNVKISTDEVLTIDGNPLLNAEFIIVKRKPMGNRFEYSAQQLPQKKIGIIGPVDFNDDDAIAENQEKTGAGNLTLTASPVIITNQRKVGVTTTGDNTGINITVTGKDIDGGAQVSTAFPGTNGDRATAIDGSGDDLIWSEVSQVSVSGAVIGTINVGIFLDFENATDEDKQYGFIAREDGLINDTTDGYYIW